MGMCKKIVKFLIVFLIFFSFNGVSFAVDETSTPTPSVTITPVPDTSKEQQDLQNKINELQGKVKDLQGQERTLSSQINVMDNQIKLTELRINSTKQQIVSISGDIQTANKKIDSLEQALRKLTKVLINRIVVTYEVGSIQPFHILLASDNAQDFLSRLSYLKVAQENDKKLIFATQQAKNDYVTQKQIFEDKKKKVEALKTQLEAYTKQLSVDKQNRQRLLTETQGDEANYQKLLAQAEAQLAAFSNFAAARGGASILNNQTVCDDWGCYYNQRDSQWGNNSLNNTKYTIASDGCLVTAMAMVYTHYGHRGVTPLTINSRSENFASYYPAYLSKTIMADGAISSRVNATIDSILSSGHPVVVGVSYDGGPIPDHFVVIISGSNGNYKMNDPFTPNGHNIDFSSYYSVGGIREIAKVVF
ncbi:MAG: hypothetical protein HYV37_01635 [Candidatus Levyibacteriota bacterium]|nr:MAG: hypothetical protein HYV37_01635 [Candidatus Levybacteria bacterium]